MYINKKTMFYLEGIMSFTDNLTSSKQKYFKREIDNVLNSNDYKQFMEYLQKINNIDSIIYNRFITNFLYNNSYNISNTTVVEFDINGYKQDILNIFGGFNDDIDNYLIQLFDNIIKTLKRIDAYNNGLRCVIQIDKLNNEINEIKSDPFTLRIKKLEKKINIIKCDEYTKYLLDYY